MTIETKYNINDAVWFFYNNKAECKPIWNIDVSISKSSASVTYVFFEERGSDNHKHIMEKHCFPNKEALLQSL